ncbi:MAG TPA: dipeptide ABC transporter ATP-binding protein DppD, partial [Saprospirales bacterium]|nr:dipeptide ABC transporter ATP-binding protein DppD [Saprospirales bacterium]
PNSNNNNVLSIKELQTVFINDGNEFEAVKKVSFDIPKGSTIGIVGESGSGKSVTSLSIMRLIPSPPGFIKNGCVDYLNKIGESRDILSISESEMCNLRGNV